MEQVKINNRNIVNELESENQNNILHLATKAHEKIAIEEQGLNEMKEHLSDEINNLEIKSNEIANVQKMLIEENTDKKNTLDLSKHLNSLSTCKINEFENSITNVRTNKENEQNIN